MLAAASILASIGDRPFIRQARRAGVYASLTRPPLHRDAVVYRGGRTVSPSDTV